MADDTARSPATPPASRQGALRAAGVSDVGRRRDVNEDRLHVDANRGIFIVVDGVGGQAAGGRAADIAIRMLRQRLERQTGPTADRVREAITIANNAIYEAALQRPEWHGMACVLTVAVVEGTRAVVGHVGDTRLYLITAGSIEKVTPDHSPVGEREDARQISERDAMRHPRRNEVFRDVGSARHDTGDPDFMFVAEIDFRPDDALLLCSDGLTDLVPIDSIRRVLESRGRDPEGVASSLVELANTAGGKDNVTVVYVEGDRYPGLQASGAATRAVRSAPAPAPGRGGRVAGFLVILAAVAIAGWFGWRDGWLSRAAVTDALAPSSGAIVVTGDESIQSAIDRASPGFVVLVEPGEYRERLALKDNVRLISRVPRGAVLRLPPEATDQEAAVIAAGVVGAELVGFRIIGDAASALGVGIITRDAAVRFVDLEIAGATTAAIDIGTGGDVVLIGSDIRGNPGAALIVRTGATPRITHNAFSRNATSDSTVSAFLIEPGAEPSLARNVFHGTSRPGPEGDDTGPARLLPNDNWFIDAPPGPRDAGTGGAGDRDRQP